MEYASRHIFLGVAGKKARQGARVSGYDCALAVFYETPHTPASVREMLSRINSDPIQLSQLCASVEL
jgi:hypothetical protein